MSGDCVGDGAQQNGLSTNDAFENIATDQPINLPFGSCEVDAMEL
ncbi:MAG: hypothetical protein QOF64_78 [Candidatus Binatota bacterium]|nr:hypothetical protein [Candidatus Binatota bacterium]